MEYIPKPLDVSDVELPDSIIEILEDLSKNTHEIWAAARYDEGWRYGRRRNDKRKTTPLMVPYEELPAGEKEYDKKVITNLLKTLVKLGYNVDREK